MSQLPDPRDAGYLIELLKETAAARDFTHTAMETVNGLSLPAFTRRSIVPQSPIVYVSAGIHGDEPAGPLAILHLLREGFFAEELGWKICPVLNPTGLAAGTRENQRGVDLNRDYRNPREKETRAHVAWLTEAGAFDAAFCLHEDWEANGFYVYELNSAMHHSPATALLEGASAHCTIEKAKAIDGRPADNGIIRPIEDVLEMKNWPEAVYIFAHNSRLGYTLETPSSRPLEDRVRTLAGALSAALSEIPRP